MYFEKNISCREGKITQNLKKVSFFSQIRLERISTFRLIFQKEYHLIIIDFFKNQDTIYRTCIFINIRMIIEVEGILFMMQSWFRAQLDKKKFSKTKKKESTRVFSLVFLENLRQISLFLCINVMTNIFSDYLFSTGMIQKIEGIAFMIQSHFRA